MTARVPRFNEKKSLPWDQTGFIEWQEQLPKARHASDQQALTNIFNLAAKSPTLKKELQWAEAHGIRFFVDHRCRGVKAYYADGAGVIGLSLRESRSTDRATAASYIAHEIRHAWQDYNNMLPSSDVSFARYTVTLSLMEADASSFQRAVFGEIRGPKAREPEWNTPYVSMADTFKNWYSSWRAEAYGKSSAEKYGVKYHLDIHRRRNHYECDAYLPGQLECKFDLGNYAHLEKLGEDFDGKRYFRLKDMKSFFKAVAINEGMALKYFSATRKEPAHLVKQVCDQQAKRLRRNYLRKY